jgi:hypothetical protein
MHRTWVLALVLAGCGGDSKPTTSKTTPATPAATDRCAPAAEHVVDLMSQLAKDAPPERVASFKQSFVQHCQKDKWSTDMQSCVIDAKKQDDFEKCDTFMTPEQKEALSKDDNDDGGGAAGAAPPPPAQAVPANIAQPKPEPAAKSVMPDDKKRSSKPKKGGDPCEGGE